MQEPSTRRLFQTASIVVLLVLIGWGLLAREGESGALPGSVGPDVTVINLVGVVNFTNTVGGAQPAPCPPGYGNGAEDCRGYAVGTDSCNIGSVPLDWCDQTVGCRDTTDAFHPIAPATSSDHPVIAQNMYRLRGGRFEQIGASFLKHGFLAVNESDPDCAWNDGGTPNTSCVGPPAGFDQLGVGCTDFYAASLNGSRPLGRRSDVEAAGGRHPSLAAGGEADDDHDQRIVVAESDLDPAENTGALYWLEGHYVVRDDARAGNGLNNASYRRAAVGSQPNLNITLSGETVRESPAIFAWQAEDGDVEIVAIDKETFFSGEAADPPAAPGTVFPDYTVTERFYAARKVTDTGQDPLRYHYEYAIFNMNSTTAADGLTIDFGRAVVFGNVGFRDLPHHSGEPYDTSDWTVEADGPNGVVRWRAVDVGADTNALRWGFTFNFWFDADTGPFAVRHDLDTFEDSGTLAVPFVDPSLIFADGFESGGITRWQ